MTTKVTGYKLQANAKRLKLQIELLRKQFEESIFQFDGEAKQDLATVGQALKKAETEQAQVNHYQSAYNHNVNVVVLGTTMTLDEAIKRVGSAGRLQKLWTKALLGGDGSDTPRWSRISNMQTARDKDKEYAQRSMSIEDCQLAVEQASRYNSALREAIQVGNGNEIELAEQSLVGLLKD